MLNFNTEANDEFDGTLVLISRNVFSQNAYEHAKY